uniref:Hemagglutinin n=1 Tax=Hubei orthoptera virus 6 TaxID=1923014 RepID=A0A1L3KKP9_9VIRU|nr:hemagglutinin [Hubei orthoptera virus 6]
MRYLPLFLSTVLGAFLVAEGRVCSSQVTQGPYTLKHYNVNPEIESTKSMSFTVSIIEEDAVIMIGYRAYWRSYCYNGGSLDPNTGCRDELTNHLPDKKEAEEWMENKGCKVQKDCDNCWGSDSDQCTGDFLENRGWHYVEHKELRRASSNNHFAHHTCNLQWRCGFHEAGWETYLTINSGTPIPYVVNMNSTPIYTLDLHYTSYSDYFLFKERDAKIRTYTATLDCHGRRQLICYDKDTGIIIDLKDGKTQCFANICYTTSGIPLEEQNVHNLVQKKGASLEDLEHAYHDIHLNHEELKYNFLILNRELNSLRKTITTMIESLAKIDDRLIGEILGNSGRTRFLSKSNFLISPCSADLVTNTNCVNNSIFEDGRWVHNEDLTKCITFNGSQDIEVWQSYNLWYPDIVLKKTVGVVGDQEGWSFLASSKSSLIDSMLVTKNMGKSTSVGDVFNLPAGTVDSALKSLFAGKIILVVAFIVIALVLVKICMRLFR